MIVYALKKKNPKPKDPKPKLMCMLPVFCLEHGFTEGCSASKAAANDLHLWR